MKKYFKETTKVKINHNIQKKIKLRNSWFKLYI